MSEARVGRRRKLTGLAWFFGGVALYIFLSTLLARWLDIEMPLVAVLAALCIVFSAALRGPARLHAFLRSRKQARHGLTWLGFCAGVAVAWPLTTHLFTILLNRLGL